MTVKRSYSVASVCASGRTNHRQLTLLDGTVCSLLLPPSHPASLTVTDL